MSGPSIVLEELSKVYLLRGGFPARLGQAFSTVSTGLLGRLGQRLVTASRGRHITALHPLSTTIEAGETVAILGRNGSGKSTLLSLIANVLSPSSGHCRMTGEVSAILELAGGFHPDFSGRDNIRHKAALRGIKRRALETRMDEILGFADIGEYIDDPVSTYSTGMQMRLAFALNTVLDPDILIVDEALSVGDTFFQARCIRWIEDYIARNRIFLCVSHDIMTVRKLCRRGIVLERGRMIFDGPIGEATNVYYESNRGRKVSPARPSQANGKPAAGEEDWRELDLRAELHTGSRAVELVSLQTAPGLPHAFPVGGEIRVRLRLRANEAVENHHFGFGLRDKRGLLYGGLHTFYEKGGPRPLEAGEEVEASFTLMLSVPPGEYLLLVGVTENLTASDWIDYDVYWDAAAISVAGPPRFWGLAALPHRDLTIRPGASTTQTPS